MDSIKSLYNFLHKNKCLQLKVYLSEPIADLSDQLDKHGYEDWFTHENKIVARKPFKLLNFPKVFEGIYCLGQDLDRWYPQVIRTEISIQFTKEIFYEIF